ncbi:MAG: T9SS type A sorting domain-containing protein [FCB group bacterium]|nr:T9SS type A sorting domain-containing protein [FCB group bacterium]
MKVACLTLLTVLGTVISVSAVSIDTVEFSYDKLELDPYRMTVAYSDFDFISDNGRPSVPVTGLVYHGLGNFELTQLYGRVLEADTLMLGFQPRLNGPDQITADNNLVVEYQNVLRPVAGRYPAQNHTATVSKIKSRTVWSMTVYPVQFLGDDKIIFNRQIEICSEGTDGEISPGRGDMIDDYPQTVSPLQASLSAFTSNGGCPLGGNLVIVTSPALAESFTALLDLKRRTGFDAALAITDSIYSLYDGIDEAEKLRNYLKDFYQAGGQWVILGGDEHQVPIRYAYYYNTETPPDLYHSMICDMYFADYDGDWDYDGDGIWGEPTEDQPDMGPEVALGRLPFGSAEQVLKYTAKLEAYLFNPGGGESAYLNRAAFFTSDQMRDYFDGGQQYEVAKNLPGSIDFDCENLAESPTGDDLAPSGPMPVSTIDDLADGYGLISILAHGRPDGFVLNSSGYNQFPKNYILTGDGHTTHAAFGDLPRNQKTSLYYSISCDQGAIDLETLYGMSTPSMVESLLSLDSAGAIGIVAFSRWGWVASSYKLMASFYQHLFDDAEGNPVAAMYASWVDYPYYRDQIYGQNFYGDPSINVYRDHPVETTIDGLGAYYPSQTFESQLILGDTPLSEHPLSVRIGEATYQTIVSDAEGNIELDLPGNCTEDIRLTLFVAGQVSAEKIIRPAFLADADDDDPPPVPHHFELRQNYPNPFNPLTTIGFSLDRSEHVSLTVYNILGRVVDVLLDELSMAGEHEVVWDGTDRYGSTVASGIYFYRLIAADRTETRKMVLVR